MRTKTSYLVHMTKSHLKSITVLIWAKQRLDVEEQVKT